MRQPSDEERADARIEVTENRLIRDGRCLSCGEKLYGGGGENPYIRYCECEEEEEASGEPA